MKEREIIHMMKDKFSIKRRFVYSNNSYVLNSVGEEKFISTIFIYRNN